MQSQVVSKTWRSSAWILAAMVALSSVGVAQKYQQNNLDSDIQGLAKNPPSGTPDAKLLNPWGIATPPGGPLWVSDNNAGVSTLYNGAGDLQKLVVNIPSPVSGVPGTPTGVVFTGSSGFQFTEKGVKTGASFTFVTEDGTIVAWLPGVSKDLPNDAFVVVDNSLNPTAANGAVYKGATTAKIGNNSFLYVTNFRAGRIEVYDTNFQPVSLDEDGDKDSDGAFRDHEIPPGFAPFNVQEANGDLYVTYAKQNSAKHDDFDAPGLGFVDKFSTSGKLLQRLERGPWLDAPWGVAFAPASFGFFGNHLLIGNAGSGQIAVYDPTTGRFDGLLRDGSGHALQNQRLWALYFSDGISRTPGAPPSQGPANTLFFTAGVNDEVDGLFGTITPADNATPEADRDDH